MLPSHTSVERPRPGSGAASCTAPSATSMSNARPPDIDRKLVQLVLAARAGNSSAWTKLIGRFDTTLRGVAGSFGLAPADVNDIVQATWVDLLQDIGSLREPAAIAGWLATATRRKAIRFQRARAREHPTDGLEVSEHADLHGPEANALACERRAVLGRAVATLPGRHRRLMTLMLANPTLDYQQISHRLAMPVGSIGPIRARSLARLSRHPELRALCVSQAPAPVPSP
jgi:RNA polymerase sigma factor (sigma-70 family)